MYVHIGVSSNAQQPVALHTHLGCSSLVLLTASIDLIAINIYYYGGGFTTANSDCILTDEYYVCYLPFG